MIVGNDHQRGCRKTRQYDQAMGPGEPCSCNDCKNYCARVKAAYPAAAEYLAGLGVEIEKPLETSPLEPGADGMMEYRACPIDRCTATYV